MAEKIIAPRIRESDVEIRVAAREKIEVPAGVFDTFRLEISGWSTGCANVRVEHRVWVAPDRLRAAVAGDWSRRSEEKVLQYEREERVSYRQS